MKAKVYITLKDGVLDPQGIAIKNTLGHLDFSGIEGVRQGKFIEIDFIEKDQEKVEKAVDDMCRKLLANTVIENYRFEIENS